MYFDGKMAVSDTMEIVNLLISSNVAEFFSQKRYPSSTTVTELKYKLELVTGASAETVQLQLLDSNQQLVCELNDDQRTLQSYGAKDGMTIHVMDKDPAKTRSLIDDTSQVKKYEMSESDYAKRTDSVRAFKQKMKLGQFADKDDEAAKQRLQEEEEQQASTIVVGSRCEVTLQGIPPRRGTVMFVGKTHFKSGYWVGVRYDEPLGKNDGSVEGHKYFECPAKYGAFVKPKWVQIGDFPEENYSDDEM